MSQLPGARIVEMTKVEDYLLNGNHPTGRAKARFFSMFGFDAADPIALALALDRHGAVRPVSRITRNDFGTKHEVRCNLPTPDGRDPCIVSIWFQPTGETGCRLVTSYPVQP